MLPYDRYARVSRIGDRSERLRSRDWQDRETLQAALSRNIEAGPFFYDPDESGANPERDDLLAIIRRIEDGVSGGIIVAKLDRFSRDMRQALDLAARIHDAGGKIISYAERADWVTPDGELQVHIALAFSHYQRRVLGESFEKAKAGAINAGIPVHPRLPPGLHLVVDEHGNRRGVEPSDDAAVMAEFFDRRAAGAGPTALADFLQVHGIRTSMGSTSWSKQAIYGLIRNRAYLGELRQGDHVNEHAWEPLVDRVTWEAAQHPTVQPSREPRGDHPDLAVGLGRCASCRYALNATNTSRGRRLYRCTIQHAGGRCPAPARAYADELEPLVLEAFWTLVRQHHGRSSTTVDRGQLDSLRAAAERAERALVLYRDDPELEETIEAMGGMPAWREGLAVRRKRRDDTVAAVVREERALAKRAPEVPTLTTLRRDWPAMSHADRRARLRDLIDCIALLPRSSGLPLADRVVVFAAGHGPDDLPRRGFRERPTIRPLDIPASLRAS